MASVSKFIRDAEAEKAVRGGPRRPKTEGNNGPATAPAAAKKKARAGAEAAPAPGR